MVQSLFSFHNRATLTELLKLAWPVVLARLGIMTMGLTDVIVGATVLSLLLALAVKVHQTSGTRDPDALSELGG